MKKLMVTSALLALILGRAWTNADEPASPTVPSQSRTVIQEAEDIGRAVSRPGQAKAAVVAGPSYGSLSTEGQATAVMGIIVQPVSAALAAHLPVLGEEQGWLVSDILYDSPLGGVDGLKLYDVIVTVDGQPIDTIRQLRRTLAMSLGIAPIPVEIIRAGKAKTAELKCFPGSEKVPRQVGRPVSDNQSVSISFADRDLSLALASIDGVNYQLEVTYRDTHGQSMKQRLAGTSAQILEQTGSFPAPVQQAIRRALAPTPLEEGTLKPSTPKDAVQPRTQEPARSE